MIIYVKYEIMAKDYFFSMNRHHVEKIINFVPLFFQIEYDE